MQHSAPALKCVVVCQGHLGYLHAPKETVQLTLARPRMAPAGADQAPLHVRLPPARAQTLYTLAPGTPRHARARRPQARWRRAPGTAVFGAAAPKSPRTPPPQRAGPGPPPCSQRPRCPPPWGRSPAGAVHLALCIQCRHQVVPQHTSVRAEAPVFFQVGWQVPRQRPSWARHAVSPSLPTCASRSRSNAGGVQPSRRIPARCSSAQQDARIS